MSFTTLLRRETRALAFGLLHTIAATLGQTFVISLFLPGIKAAFGLTDAEASLLFTATRPASAIAVCVSVHGSSCYTWVDQFNTLRLGRNVPINTGNESEGLLVLKDSKWVILRVPYPLGFYSYHNKFT